MASTPHPSKGLSIREVSQYSLRTLGYVYGAIVVTRVSSVDSLGAKVRDSHGLNGRGVRLHRMTFNVQNLFFLSKPSSSSSS